MVGKARPPKDLTGQSFGRWQVLRYDRKDRSYHYWASRCSCGVERSVVSFALTSGSSQSCGCLRVETMKAGAIHGDALRRSRSREYAIWGAMIQRCRNPNNASFKHYGGRGIEICLRWRVFANFLDDMGRRPSPKHTLERDNNSRGYEPGNCRWATRAEQSRNKRSNIHVLVDGRRMVLTDAVARVGGQFHTVQHLRERGGLSPQRAFDQMRKALNAENPPTG